MSSDLRSTTAKPRLGPWLTLLIAQNFLGAAFILQLQWSDIRTLLGTGLGTYLIFEIAACIAVGCLLLWRKAFGLMIVLTLYWIGAVVGGVMLLWPFDLVAQQWSVRELPWFLDVINARERLLCSVLESAGWIAYLLTTPRLATLYTGPQVRYEQDDLYTGLASRFLMIGLLFDGVLGVMPILLVRFFGVTTGATTSEPNSTALVPVIGLALLSRALPALLLWRGRKWRYVQVALAGLWLVPICLGSSFLLGPAASGFAKLDDLSFARLVSAASLAIAWTAYLMESPYIAIRYPGRRRRHDLVTDVDVF